VSSDRRLSFFAGEAGQDLRSAPAAPGRPELGKLGIQKGVDIGS